VNAGEFVRIESLTVNGAEARINLASGARLDRVDLNARTDIAGAGGSIGTLNANAGSSGSHIEPQPGSTTNAPGVSVTTGGEPPPRDPNGGGGSGGGGAGGGGGGGVVQQPIETTFTVMTTVSVPDGGTILMGGVKLLSEGRQEYGIPMINKIPYLKRLFSNTAVGRETKTMMLMVTPHIIIQEEYEESMGTAENP